MKKTLWTIALALGMAGNVKAQGVDDVLRAIEQNNKELQSLAQAAHAASLDVQSRNNLEDPTVEYSPFYAKGIDGVATSELIVSQSFDFPTLYAARHQAGRLQQQAIGLQHRVARRDLLLEAKNLCLDLIRLNKENDLLTERMKHADRLLALFEKRLHEGDASLLDVNKIKMERMTVQTELTQNHAAHRTALQQLLAMNANQPLDFAATDYPAVSVAGSYDTLRDQVMAADLGLQAADLTARAARKEVNVSRQNWLPKLSVGYRRNTELNEASNGFLVGGSLPLFSNRKKTRMARAQAVSAELAHDDARLKAEAALQSGYNELQQLQAALEAYDLPLMKKSLSLLGDAVTAGELSVIEFYVEADNIYRNLQSYLETENRYQKRVADLYKNAL